MNINIIYDEINRNNGNNENNGQNLENNNYELNNSSNSNIIHSKMNNVAEKKDKIDNLIEVQKNLIEEIKKSNINQESTLSILEQLMKKLLGDKENEENAKKEQNK